MQHRSFIGRVAVTVVATGCGIRRQSDPLDSGASGAPELEPWTTWRRDSREGPLALVRAAILASNAHNAQPWRFRVSNRRIEVCADLGRTLGAVDPFLRTMHLSLGCAVENLVLASRPNGYDATVTLLPGNPGLATDASGVQRVAVVDLAPTARGSGMLYEAIPHRHTDRTPYDPARPLPAAFVRTLGSLGETDTVQIYLFEDEAARREIIRLIGTSNVMFTDQEVAQANARWAWKSLEEFRQRRDGFLVGPAAGAPPQLSHAAIMLRAPLFGMLAVRDRYDRQDSLRAGRVWQRAHLLATAHGVAARPENGAVELVDFQRRLHRPPSTAREIDALTGDASWQPTLMFYMGYSLTRDRISPRRPVEDVRI